MTAHDSKLTAWVTGAGGLIGSALVRTAPANLTVIGLTRESLDLTDPTAVRTAFQRDQPQLIIHCAALSRSTDCERDPDLAWEMNVSVTTRLAEVAQGSRLIFFSTDLVFDGRKTLYSESDTPSPLSFYGRTKAAAEDAVLKHPGCTVIRTSLNGGTSPRGDRGFNEQMRRAWAEGKELTMFTDEFRSPIAAQETARITWNVAVKGEPGLYHVAGSERMSRWDLGKLMAARWPALNPKIRPGTLKSYTGDPRPPDTSLNCEKVQRILSYPVPAFSQWLQAQPQGSF